MSRTYKKLLPSPLPPPPPPSTGQGRVVCVCVVEGEEGEWARWLHCWLCCSFNVLAACLCSLPPQAAPSLHMTPHSDDTPPLPRLFLLPFNTLKHTDGRHTYTNGAWCVRRVKVCFCFASTSKNTHTRTVQLPF